MNHERARVAGVAGGVVAALCLTIGVGNAAAAPADNPDVGVSLPYQRTLTIGASIIPGRSEVVVPVTNTGTGDAHDVTVTITSVPARFATHTVIPTLAAGATTTVSLGEDTRQIYLGYITVHATEAEPDANPSNNTAAGIRLFVGDFTGIG